MIDNLTKDTPNPTGRPLTVAVSLDIPPYVMANATRGFEVDFMRGALSNYSLKWLQMDYLALESAVSEKKADVAMSVQGNKANTFYSVDYVGFINFAITRKSDNLRIGCVADLKGHPVLTWENAWTELGNEFKQQYAPGSAERPNYIEVADQSQQVRQFWDKAGNIIVIDRSIFDYFSERSGHALSEAEYHNLFPEPARFKVGFADSAMRDEFNAGLRNLCRSGDYGRLLKSYHMPDMAGVCNRLKD